MLCKNLNIESPYSNLEVEFPTKGWFIHKDNGENDWNEVLPMIAQANCDLVDVSAVTEAVYPEISRSLNTIQFPFLTKLTLESIPIFGLEILTWLNAPNLFHLRIEKTNLTSTKSLHKTNFKKIKYIFLFKLRSISIKNHQVQQYEMLPRMRVCTAPFACHHTKGNLLLMGLYAQNSDFMFQVKVESNNVIANIKQSYKVETNESLKEAAAELEVDQQTEIVSRWNKKYSLIMKNCRRILRELGESQEVQNIEH